MPDEVIPAIDAFRVIDKALSRARDVYISHDGWIFPDDGKTDVEDMVRLDHALLYLNQIFNRLPYESDTAHWALEPMGPDDVSTDVAHIKQSIEK